MSTSLRSAPQSGVLLLRLESNDGYPRLERAVLASLGREIRILARDPNLNGAVITGTEQSFASGAEILEVAELAKLSAAHALEFSLYGQSVFRSIENSAKPVVAAICGFCMGGGFDLALACHIRLASPDVVFAHPGGALGIVTGWGGTQRLPHIIGRSHALEMLTTGARWDAAEALRIGLIAEIVSTEALLGAALDFASARTK